MTHSELVARGVNWLKNNRVSTMRMPIVLPEYRCYADSIPDIIGLNHDKTVVIECKVSHPDYLNDQRKGHRRHAIQLGNLRYYLCPVGLLHPEEINNGWGLLYCHSHKITIEKQSDIFAKEQTRPQEYQVMYSIIRRLTSYDGHDKMIEILRDRHYKVEAK